MNPFSASSGTCERIVEATGEEIVGRGNAGQLPIGFWRLLGFRSSLANALRILLSILAMVSR